MSKGTSKKNRIHKASRSRHRRGGLPLEAMNLPAKNPKAPRPKGPPPALNRRARRKEARRRKKNNAGVIKGTSYPRPLKERL